MSLFGYNCDYNNFIKHYNIDSHDHYMNGCVCRGIVFSLDFCNSILSCKDIQFPDYVYKAAYSKLIMNNFIDESNIIKYNPFCIWYPQLPSKETCINLTKIKSNINYSVAIVSILMNWEDVWSLCGNLHDSFLYDLAIRCNRNWVPECKTTKVYLKYEEITEYAIKCDINDFFKFRVNMDINIFSIAYSAEYDYLYPLGLKLLYSHGFEYHMINKNNKTYTSSDDYNHDYSDE